MMNKQLLSKVPTFYKEKDIYTTILANDWDALLSCAVEKEVNNWDINHFYDFESMWVLNSSNTKEYVGLDLALTKGKNIDNHLMGYNYGTLANEQGINLNTFKGINTTKYYKKFPLSTFLLLVSLHDIPLNYNDDMLIKFLLTIDSAHKGFYADKEFFKQVYVDWMEDLGLTRFLDILNKTDIKEFNNISAATAKHGKQITINNDGFLTFGKGTYDLDKFSKRMGFKVELPAQQFTKTMEFENKNFSVNSVNPNSFMNNDEVFSYAFTYKNNGRVSYIKK